VAAAVFAILTLAFSSDPAARWTWPDPKAYLGAFPHFAKAFGGAAFGQGSAHRIGAAGAALWLPPGTGSDESAIDALMQSTADAQTAVDGPQVMQQMARYHPREPHWYLPLIGIDPAHQGKGLGGALLKYATNICDRDGVLAYLESSNLRNVPLYERHGFEAIGTIRPAARPRSCPCCASHGSDNADPPCDRRRRRCHRGSPCRKLAFRLSWHPEGRHAWPGT
jgi:GNAT superfamily N-acetyltransferase